MLWAHMLAYVTGTVNQELLLRNEYLTAENRVLRNQIKGRLLLSEAEKATLAEIAHRLGREALNDVAATATPDTILGWYRKLVARKFDGSKSRKRVGRPKADAQPEKLVVRTARENPGWGYDRIVGALANLGRQISDQTVGKHSQASRHIARAQTEADGSLDGFHSFAYGGSGRGRFLYGGSLHAEGTRDLLRVVFHSRGEPEDLHCWNDTHPDEAWMKQQARNATLEKGGYQNGCRYVLHDRDTKFCKSFRQTMESGNVEAIRLPARSPNLNAYAERWVRSVKEECLSKLILFGEGSLKLALREYQEHYHEERNHQGKQNRLLFARDEAGSVKSQEAVRGKERLGGLLRYYQRQAA